MRRLPLCALVSSLIVTAGCTPENSGTGGRSVIFRVGNESPAYMTGQDSFITATGWTVRLDEAWIAVGPIYLWENPPGFRSAPTDGFDPLAAAYDLVVPSAHAHPGATHFDGGTLRGEFMEQFVLDLTRPDGVELGIARGIEGPVDSMVVILDPPTQSTRGEVEALQGHHAWVSGTAEKDGQVIEFEGGLDVPAEGGQREVSGLSVSFELDTEGTFVFGIHPRAWFDQAHFDRLDMKADSGRMLITPDSQPGIAWLLGIRSKDGFFARWTTEQRFTTHEAADD